MHEEFMNTILPLIYTVFASGEKSFWIVEDRTMGLEFIVF